MVSPGKEGPGKGGPRDEEGPGTRRGPFTSVHFYQPPSPSGIFSGVRERVRRGPKVGWVTDGWSNRNRVSDQYSFGSRLRSLFHSKNT